MAIYLRTVFLVVILAAILFGCAGRWDLPFVWAYIVVMVITTVSVKRVVDPALLHERAHPGQGGEDRHLRFLAVPFYFAHWVIAGLDVGRFHWSDSVPLVVQIVGLIGFSLFFALTVWAMKVNRFFSSVVRIQEERGHHLVSDGPYRFIRHPGYALAGSAFVCGAIMLGSWLCVVPILMFIPLLIRRTIIEDRFLHAHLDGYAAYAQKVRFRLVPGLW